MMSIQNDLNEALNNSKETIWASRIELSCKPGTPEIREGYVGGFVTVLVKCSSALEFISLATKHLEDEGFDILAVEDLAPLSEEKFLLNGLIQGLVKKTDQYPLQWSTFDLYRNNDE